MSKESMSVDFDSIFSAGRVVVVAGLTGVCLVWSAYTDDSLAFSNTYKVWLYIQKRLNL